VMESAANAVPVNKTMLATARVSFMRPVLAQ
jgi:hypothetical protein